MPLGRRHPLPAKHIQSSVRSKQIMASPRKAHRYPAAQVRSIQKVDNSESLNAEKVLWILKGRTNTAALSGRRVEACKLRARAWSRAALRTNQWAYPSSPATHYANRGEGSFFCSECPFPSVGKSFTENVNSTRQSIICLHYVLFAILLKLTKWRVSQKMLRLFLQIEMIVIYPRHREILIGRGHVINVNLSEARRRLYRSWFLRARVHFAAFWDLQVLHTLVPLQTQTFSNMFT